MKSFAVIVAGGKGSRMNSDLPKQFMLLLEIPVLMHTIERFAMAIPEVQIVLVLPTSQVSFWEKLCLQMDFDIPHKVVEGGNTRYESVRNGLGACDDEGIVGIHDGVRPLITPEFVARCFTEAEKHGSALPTVPVTQSLRKVQDGRSEAMSREGIHAVQTPQCFDLSKLKQCYQQPHDDRFTDDATVFELAGHSIHLVEGEETNLKITTPADLKIAEAILSLSQG